MISKKNNIFKDEIEDILAIFSIPGCGLLFVGLIVLVLFIVCMCVFDIRLPETDNSEKQNNWKAKNIAWDYLKEQSPYAQIKTIKTISSSGGIYIVEGEFKQKNAFGQWSHHSFRATVKNGNVTGFDTNFIGFK